MPFRLDLTHPPPSAVDLLIDWGALDIEPFAPGLAAILPDTVTPQTVFAHFGSAGVSLSPAVSRDDGSVWLLHPRPIRAGGLLITAAPSQPGQHDLRLLDSDAFGTGHHPTTVLCLDALASIVPIARPASILDVGTGSGILALAALKMGVPTAVGIDSDPSALHAAEANAHCNGLSDRVQFVHGAPGDVDGNWPLIVANILTAPLIQMAPLLAQRLGTRGQMILSGIHASLVPEVRHAYQHCGLRLTASETRAGWTALIAQAPW